jgi:hypothetical protein
MAAPKRNRTHPDDPTHEKTRKLIQTTQLVKRLNQYALNQKDEAGQEVEIDSGRLKAIEARVDASISLEKLSEEELSAKIAEFEAK